jgi:SAM-dependent methyltransferase
VDVTAVDFSRNFVERVRERCDADKVTPMVANGESLPSEWTSKFDVVVSSFGVIFFPDIKRGLEEIKRVLKPNGVLLLSAWGSVEETEAFRIFPDALQEIELQNATQYEKQNVKQIPRQISQQISQHDPSKARIDGSPSSLTALLTESGFSDVRIRGPCQRYLTVSDPLGYYNRFATAAPGTIGMLDGLSDRDGERLKQRVMELVEERCGVGVRPCRLPASAYFAECVNVK